MISTAQFEAARPRLLAIAHRMLGSIHDAEDAVQATWLRADSAATGEVDNPVAWLTTVLTRLCLDQLRERRAWAAWPEFDEEIPDEVLAAEEDFIQREDISRAVLVLISQLTPAQRVCYVLHDLFSVPFDHIAEVLGTTTTAAKKHASRARGRIRGADAAAEADDRQHRAVVAAFLSAARGGDIDRMIALMAPECVRVADAALLPPGSATEVKGAAAVAEETRQFVDRIRASTPLRVNGRLVDVIAPGGRALAAIDIDTVADRVVSITINPIRGTDVLTAA